MPLDIRCLGTTPVQTSGVVPQFCLLRFELVHHRHTGAQGYKIGYYPTITCSSEPRREQPHSGQPSSHAISKPQGQWASLATWRPGLTRTHLVWRSNRSHQAAGRYPAAAPTELHIHTVQSPGRHCLPSPGEYFDPHQCHSVWGCRGGSAVGVRPF